MAELFRDTFGVRECDKEGKQFDNIIRLSCTSNSTNAELVLDVNSEMLECHLNDYFELCLVDSESPVWEPSMFESWRSSGWDYVMHGKIFRYESSAQQTATVYASYGGLLMQLTAGQTSFDTFSVGRDLFLQLRKL
jgi:hypothetical protein